MPSIKLNVGDGLGFTNDTPSALTVNAIGEDISKSSNGLFVDDLSGDGSGTNSRADGWSLIESTSTTGYPIPDINRNVSNLIFSMCAYQITGRGTGTSTAITVNTSAVKTIQQMVDEMNRPLVRAGNNWSSYHPLVGELFQLISVPHGRSIYVTGGPMEAAEDGNRYPDNANRTLALFCITGIEYATNSNYVNKIRMICLYSSLSAYTKGQTYDNY